MNTQLAWLGQNLVSFLAASEAYSINPAGDRKSASALHGTARDIAPKDVDGRPEVLDVHVFGRDNAPSHVGVRPPSTSHICVFLLDVMHPRAPMPEQCLDA